MKDIVMIPGLGSNGTVWGRTVAALGDAVSCVIGDTLHDDSLTGMAERILDSAPAQFVLAGVSMGGMVALEIARLAPGRIRALALIDTTTQPDTQEQAESRRTANRKVLQSSDFLGLAKSVIRDMVHPLADASVIADLEAMTLSVGREAYVRQNEAVIARPDLRPVLAKIAVPTLVAVGAQDRMTPVPCAEAIRDNIVGAELHVIADCGHLPPIEKPDVTAKLLRALWARTLHASSVSND